MKPKSNRLRTPDLRLRTLKSNRPRTSDPGPRTLIRTPDFGPWTLIIALLMLAACETPIQVDLPEQDPALVVNSLFTPDSTWNVNVSTSVVYDEQINPRDVNDAIVEIFDGDRLVERLESAGTGGVYVSPGNLKPEAGRIYTLRVKASGFDEVVGVGSAPEPIPTGGLVFEGEAFVRFEYQYSVTMDIQDIPDRKNYFGLYTLQLHKEYQGNSLLSEHYNNGFFKTRDAVLAEQDVFEPEESYFEDSFFTDELFEGRSHTLDFRVIGFQTLEAEPELSPDNTHIEIEHYVNLMTLSEDMYKYWKTTQDQDDLSDDPFATPVQAHSNLSNGFGIFAGYSQQRFRVGEE